MLQNVLSFFTKNVIWFQIALGAWQILKFTPLVVLIEGLGRRLLSLLLPGVVPSYKQLQKCPGCLFKTVKCVVLQGTSQTKTKLLTTSIMSKDTNLISNGASEPQAESISVDYLGKTFVLKKEEGNKVSVNGEISYYISDRKWRKICKMKQKYFKVSEKENEVVFVKGCRYIWEKTATGEVMEFEEVLDNVIFENKKIIISDDVWFLPVGLSKKSGGKLAKLLNLLGLFFSTHKKISLSKAKSFSFASFAFAIVFEFKPLRLRIYRIINKRFCRSVQYICNKLPYPVRRFVYLLFMWGLLNLIENLMPRNDIRLKVVRCDYLNVVIGGSAKTNSAQEATLVDWLDQEEKEYEFRCGCSIVMKATYDDVRGEYKATMQHTNAFFPSTEKRVFLKCECPEEFMKIGTFLSCLATSKAGSLIQYDRNDNKVHVRSWRRSLRHYEDAGFPEIYKLTLHDVIV